MRHVHGLNFDCVMLDALFKTIFRPIMLWLLTNYSSISQYHHNSLFWPNSYLIVLLQYTYLLFILFQYIFLSAKLWADFSDLNFPILNDRHCDQNVFLAVQCHFLIYQVKHLLIILIYLISILLRYLMKNFFISDNHSIASTGYSILKIL